MIKTNNSFRREENYNEFRRQAEQELNSRLKKPIEKNSIADLIVKLKAEAETLKKSFKQ